MNSRYFHARRTAAIAALASLLAVASAGAAGRDDARALQHAVDAAVRPVMEKNGVPGMAVAVTAGGKHFFFNYGLASREGAQAVTEDTLFEIGSVSKTFTATLASHARETGALSFADKAATHLPALAGSSFDAISLLDLATYSAGGLPLQFPDEVTDEARMADWLRRWRPAYAPGTHRLYSNPSIGLFGLLAARSMGKPFQALMEEMLFPQLGLKRTFIQVPPERMADYAWGYSKAGRPVRVTPGVLDAQAYGVKASAGDMIRFVEANMGEVPLDETLGRAIARTRTGYYQVGAMTQGLGWEMYAYPARLDQLLAGNSGTMALEANKVKRLDPPRPPRGDVLVNKTGSTNGFGAYVAFVPARRIGVVLLANRNYPIPARVEAGWRILRALAER